MVQPDDIELLREFAGSASEAAFATLVRRHVNLVYSVALRHTRSPDAAEEITQAAFILLSRKAHRLLSHKTLAGWLYETARRTARDYLRTERRRARREQEAQTLMIQTKETSSAHDEVWSQIAPLLEHAMGELAAKDRTAVVLRYFQDKSLREVGLALGTSEDAAKMRIARALDKLRLTFAKRGLACSVVTVAAALSAHSVQAAPATVAAGVIKCALAQGSSAAASGALGLISGAKFKLAIALGVTAVAITAVVRFNAQNQASSPAPVIQAVSRSATTPEAVPAAEAPASELPAATNHTVLELTSPPGFDSIRVFALNNLGQAVGGIDSTNGQTHAFIWDNGTTTDLGTFGASKSLAAGINDAGDIVGTLLTNGERHVFLRHAGEISDLGTIDGFAKLGDEGELYLNGPGRIYYIVPLAVNNTMQVAGRVTTPGDNHRSFIFDQGRTSYFGVAGNGSIFYAEAINNRGQILGRATPTVPDTDNRMRSMLWTDGDLIDLSSLNGTISAAHAINDDGAVVGAARSGTNGTNQAFIWKDGAMRYLPAGNTLESTALAINNTGLVAGFARSPQRKFFACFWKDGVLLDLNQMRLTEPGCSLVRAEALNDRGQVLVRAVDATQRQRYFLLSPSNLPPALPLQSAPTTTRLGPVSPFSLSSFERLSDGSSRLAFTGRPDAQYIVEASTDLKTWTVLGPAANNSGKVEFTDPDARKFVMRFYRVAQVPQ